VAGGVDKAALWVAHWACVGDALEPVSSLTHSPERNILVTVFLGLFEINLIEIWFGRVFLFWFGFLMVWDLTQGFTLLRQALYHLSHASSPFCFNYFSSRFSHFSSGPALDHNPPTHVSSVPGITSVLPCPLYWLRWGSS
jgi:hypothetical protein